jgi:hypothetical protein
MTKVVRVLSLGAGVQSSTLALMCAKGKVPAPEIAIFADTQDEPASVYEWLNWLETQLPFPIRRVSRGKLSATAVQTRASAAGNKYLKPMIPVYVDNNGKKGMVQRQCTSDFKIDPIMQTIRHVRNGRNVIQYLGISFDELERMKPSRVPYIENDYPLVDLRMTRQDCLKWMKANRFPEPPRSACVYCPFHSDAEWKRLSPSDMAVAVKFEKNYQAAFAASDMDGVPYLHAKRVPLDSIKFDDSEQKHFTNECEGVCGV